MGVHPPQSHKRGNEQGNEQHADAEYHGKDRQGEERGDRLRDVFLVGGEQHLQAKAEQEGADKRGDRHEEGENEEVAAVGPQVVF